MLVSPRHKGSLLHLDLGKAFAMRDLPMNLISVSEVLKLGSIVHFENDKCLLSTAW